MCLKTQNIDNYEIWQLPKNNIKHEFLFKGTKWRRASKLQNSSFDDAQEKNNHM